MSNDIERIAAWWTSLDESQRQAATEVGDQLPTWMAIGLANNGVEIAAPNPATGRVEPTGFTTPRAFREFVAAQIGR